MQTIRFRYIDHMTDSMIEAYGSTLEEAFENSALALHNTMLNLNNVTAKINTHIKVDGFDLKNLLYNWLEKVLLKLVVEKIVLCEHNIRIRKKRDNYLLYCTSKGEVFDSEKHGYKVEIKAVTYHEMDIKHAKDKFTIRFLLDL